MKTKTFFRQCTLQDGDSHTVVWIPEKYCKKGKKIQIKDDDGEWGKTYTVAHVPSIRTEFPPDYRKLIKSHRKATGDSLPKRKTKKKSK